MRLEIAMPEAIKLLIATQMALVLLLKTLLYYLKSEVWEIMLLVVDSIAGTSVSCFQQNQ